MAPDPPFSSITSLHLSRLEKSGGPAPVTEVSQPLHLQSAWLREFGDGTCAVPKFVFRSRDIGGGGGPTCAFQDLPRCTKEHHPGFPQCSGGFGFLWTASLLGQIHERVLQDGRQGRVPAQACTRGSFLFLHTNQPRGVSLMATYWRDWQAGTRGPIYTQPFDP